MPRTIIIILVRAYAITCRTRDLPHLPHQNRDFLAHTSSALLQFLILIKELSLLRL